MCACMHVCVMCSRVCLCTDVRVNGRVHLCLWVSSSFSTHTHVTWCTDWHVVNDDQHSLWSQLQGVGGNYSG